MQSESKPAAQYIRMSTEHQQYSTQNQADTIQEYAQRRGFTIVQTYADEGRSGLRIEGRDALRQMIDDAMSGEAPYEAILVYDISRWGRFQDSDESAYYEYICKRAGIQVYYCAEQFENDGSPTSTIIKSVKRAMAGEYSRELSSKVFQGQCRLIELGYRQGGPAGFGLRRMLVDMYGNPKGVLKRKEQKSLQTDRVILTPGPQEEISIVRHMYQMFIKQGKSEREIAEYLNGRGITTDADRQWTRSSVRQVLTNEKYIGTRSISATTSTIASHSNSRRNGWLIPPISGFGRMERSKQL
jgi:DNA invertase Pin-like site-specific DNA recombinase